MWKMLVAVAALVGLSGCAAMNNVDSDVSTYSQWPVDRKPASFAFERLPSQQARVQQQDQLEAAALPALKAAGFTEATDPKSADFTVQVGARVSGYDQPYVDPWWGYGGFYYGPRWGGFYGGGYYGRGGFWGPPYAYYPYDMPRYNREVALLIRERNSNQVLYEARASNDGTTLGDMRLISAMFEAAMKDFPHTGINPRQVRIVLPKTGS